MDSEKLQDRSAPPPHGYCLCGCDSRTAIAKTTDCARGRIKGEPCRYVPGHHARKPIRYVEVQTGYPTPCWIWKLAKDKDGYGREGSTTGKIVLAHRRYYEERYGPIPADRQVDCQGRLRFDPVAPVEN